MDISNKTLAFFLVAAIAVSLVGTILSLNALNELGFTGRAATDTGTTNFTIQSDIQITFTTDNVNFGTGFVNDSSPTGSMENCTIDSQNTAASTDCAGSLDSVNGGFVIRNDGNIDVSLNITSNATADQFIAGNTTLNAFQWDISDVEASSCGAGLTPTTWTEVTTTATTACTDFNAADGTDTLRLDIKLIVPQDAPTGTRSSTITAVGFQ